MSQPYAQVSMMTTPDLISLKMFQLEQALLHKEGDELIDYVGQWLQTTRRVLAERLGPLREFGLGASRQ